MPLSPETSASLSVSVLSEHFHNPHPEAFFIHDRQLHARADAVIGPAAEGNDESFGRLLDLVDLGCGRAGA